MPTNNAWNSQNPAQVAKGGTGAVSFTANGAIISNTSSTGALASVALASQKFLVGNSGAPTAKSLSVVTQVFTGSGTYTPTAGMVYCIAEVVGGGGGSGGCATTGGGQYNASGGGGGGGYSRKTISSATIGASQTVTIGAAGTAGTAGNNAGGTGGTTSLGALLSATGGAGGGGAAVIGGTEFLPVAGGAGGAGSSGDFNSNGWPGGTAFTGIANASSFAGSVSGSGGSSFFGGGAVANVGKNAAGSTVAIAGSSYGGGASGGILGPSTSQIAGAAGAAGIIVITEFVIA